MKYNKTINNIRFAHWEKASLSLSFSRYCKRYVQRNADDVFEDL
jgi:hypothetical protein